MRLDNRVGTPFCVTLGRGLNDLGLRSMKDVMSAVRPPRPAAVVSRRRALQMLGLPAGALLLAACGSASSATNLAFREGFAGARIRAIMRYSFVEELNAHARQLGIRWSGTSDASIEFGFPEDWREQYAAIARAREGPDMAELFGNGPHLLSDRLIDMSELAEEIGEAQGGWMDAARAVAVVDGVWRGIPWAFTAHALNCRRDLLDEVGVATIPTYDALLETATRLRDARLPLAAFSMSPDAPNDSGSLAYSLLWSFGGQEVDEVTGRVALNSAATREALQFFRELTEVSDPRALSFSEAGNNAAFLRGEIAITQNSSSIAWRAKQDGSELVDHIDHLRYPAGPNGYHKLLEMNTLSVFDHSPNADVATDFIRFALKPASLLERSNLSYSFFSPPLLDRIEDPSAVWNSESLFSAFKGSNDSDHVVGWPARSSIESGLVFQNATIVNMFQAVGLGELSVDEAVVAAANALRRVYET